MMDSDRAGDILRTLTYLFEPGQVIEIRAITGEGISSGYFNDFQKAAVEILSREADSHVSGIYVTLNEVNPALLARRANRIKYRLERKDAATTDADIIQRRWLPIDIDPVRPSGVSSSQEEHEAALMLADTISMFLTGQGWPAPLVADSGNGAHLLYPIDLPNNDQSRLLVHQILKLLDIRFSSTRCNVDTTNFNAARIWKVYGTIARKGDHLPDRPHRFSRIISVPQKVGPITQEILTGLLTSFPVTSSAPSSLTPQKRASDTGSPGEKGAPDYEAGAATSESTLALSSWLIRNNLTYIAKPYQGGTLFVLDSCPFSDAHTDGAYAIQFGNGAIFAGCHHDSCGGGTQRWAELRARFEQPKPDVGTRLARLRSDRLRQKNEAEGRISMEEIDSNVSEHSQERSEPSDSCISAKSLTLLAEGDPLTFLLDTFACYHEGDRQVAQCLIHSLLSRTVLNSKGLHVSISGESGKGKSHAVDTMRTLIPGDSRIEGRVSDKALFYMEDLLPGTVITLDDVSLSDQMQEILKGVTTSFQKPFPYRTVNKDRKPQVCIIPERCVWWIAKVEGAGDDQVFNRMLTCWIDDTEEQDLKVLDRALVSAQQTPDSLAGISEDVLVCRQLWKDLAQVWVIIPFARRIRFQSVENRRNPDMLLDLIRTHAGIYQQQRDRQVVGGVTCVVATREDFDHAARLFVALNGKAGGQGTKLTKRESGLIAALESYGKAEVTIVQLQRKTGWTNSSICKLLHGYLSHGKLYSGLLEKCPAVSYLDRTVTKGDEGQTTMRHARVFQWDQDLYNAWVKGGSVWLADDEVPSDDDGPDPIDPSSPSDPSRSCISTKPPTPSPSSDGEGSRTADAVFGGGASEHLISPDLEPVSEQDLPEPFVKPSRTGCLLTSIQPRDFVAIDGFIDHTPCSVCGKRRSRYRGRRVNQRSGADMSELMLCSSCYNRAVSREAAAIIPLPGVIRPHRMVPVNGSVGRCHLCSQRPAAWSDPQSRTNLCDDCYQRELMQAPHDDSKPGIIHGSSGCQRVQGADGCKRSDQGGGV